jgi:hypothetical protein
MHKFLINSEKKKLAPWQDDQKVVAIDVSNCPIIFAAVATKLRIMIL